MVSKRHRFSQGWECSREPPPPWMIPCPEEIQVFESCTTRQDVLEGTVVDIIDLMARICQKGSSTPLTPYCSPWQMYFCLASLFAVVVARHGMFRCGSLSHIIELILSD